VNTGQVVVSDIREPLVELLLIDFPPRIISVATVLARPAMRRKVLDRVRANGHSPGASVHKAEVIYWNIYSRADAKAARGLFGQWHPIGGIGLHSSIQHRQRTKPYKAFQPD
jgi:hypothetical protein